MYVVPLGDCESIDSRKERCLGRTSELSDSRTVETVASSRQPNPKRAENHNNSNSYLIVNKCVQWVHMAVRVYAIEYC